MIKGCVLHTRPDGALASILMDSRGLDRVRAPAQPFMFAAVCLFSVLGTACPLSGGMLFPRESTSRDVKHLSGLWVFRADKSPSRSLGFEKAWFKSRLSEVEMV